MTSLLLIKVVVLVVLLSSAETFAAGGVRQGVRGGDSWLDRAPANWNRRMDRLPRPDSSLDAADLRRRCRGLVRQPSSAAERALVRAGWMLYGEVESNRLTRVVTALSGADGMCRPVRYQAFVYWEGRYAGTLSPVAMDSRTDGALTDIRLTTPTTIVADFVRYNDSDPLCCPSRVSRVTYSVTRDDLPLVAPLRIRTEAAEPSGGETAGGDVSAGTAYLFGRRWTLTEIEGSAVRSGRAFIEFDREQSRFAGDGGCNRFSGVYVLDGSSLRFSRTISTRRACLDGAAQRVETNFLSRLEQVTGFRLEGDTLRLSAGRRTLLTFGAGAGGDTREGRVTGTVTYRQRIALPAGAVVEVRLLDVSRAGAPSATIAEQVIRPAGRQVPFAFELRYDPARIEERRRYAVQARILVGGSVRFTSTDSYPVITGGHPDTVNVIVRPVRR